MQHTKGVNRAKFNIVLGNMPNSGILYVNHRRNWRSGHGGNCLTECSNGDIISFYSNVYGEQYGGHGTGGWSEYRRSCDAGRTWSEPFVLAYSRREWEGEDIYSALVFGVTTAPNGTLIAYVCRFEEELWVKNLPPVYLLSYDDGVTWSEPRELDAEAGVETASLTFDATFVHDGKVFVVFMSGAANYCPGAYTLYLSEDDGESFDRRSTLPFHHENYYVTAGVLDGGDIIVYSYPYRKNGVIDEHNMDYVISYDEGRTWSEVRKAHFAQRIRNPQLSEKIGNIYFIHGRSGSQGENPANFILYSSNDGINWDEGVILKKRTPGGDCYSGNTVVGKYTPSVPKRLLIQSSVSYHGSRVNECHWWVENIQGTGWRPDTF